MKFTAPVFLTSAALLAFALSGCSYESTDSGGTDEPTASPTHADHDHDHDHDHGEHAEHAEEGDSAMTTIEASLAQLPPEDAASAEKQRVCPVSGEMLGTMGVPKKVDVNGQQVWICCEGCRDPLLENPEEHLAKLEAE